ncbi:signal peptidase I [Occultella kanbiaonis]|uniref:signal peptidase I n=1 Tax=Occultella kanbiaonis TaxID=2675754 RepID=UPI001F1F903D|nr:signal peptidase I [Occultella kanbiaonis]
MTQRHDGPTDLPEESPADPETATAETDAAPPSSSTDDAADAEGDETSDGEQDGERKPRRGPLRSFLHECVIVLVAALALSLIIKTFLAQAFYIPSISMEDTLLVGDRLVVSKLTPGPFELERGDIVVFLDPGGWLDNPESEPLNPVEQVLTWIGILPEHADEHLIKRIIGVAGDHVVCCNEAGQITVNGAAIDEPYVIDGAAPSNDPFDVVVPEGHLWVMGDNRPRSADSRYNAASVGGGFVPIRNVVGTAFVIIWPLDSITWLSNPEETFADVPDPS